MFGDEGGDATDDADLVRTGGDEGVEASLMHQMRFDA